MRENFKLASLLTSRSMNHGFGSAIDGFMQDPRCQENVQRYLANGYVDFVDGTVCEVRLQQNKMLLFSPMIINIIVPCFI